MKIIVHAPSYLCGRAADFAAKAFHDGELMEVGALIGILSGQDAFSIRRNKASISVWHSFAGRSAIIDPDKWEAF